MTHRQTLSGRLAGWAADAGRDLVLAARMAGRQPAFTLFVVLTLGLGIGVNSAMFGLLDRLLLSSPPHLRDPDRIVRAFVEQSPRNGARFSMSTLSYPSFADLHEQTRSLSRLAAIVSGQMILGRGETARPVRAAKVSADYFPLLGPRPAAGRFFGADEDRPPGGTAVAVLGHGFWQRELQGRPQAIGSQIRLDGTLYSIIGVAPAGFTGESVAPIDVWVPLHAGLKTLPAGWRDDRTLRLVAVIGRLRPGASRAAAGEEATLAYRHGMEAEPYEDGKSRILIATLTPGVGPNGLYPQARIAVWLSGVSLIVFLIAVANVTNLLLQRAAQRQAEVAVRLALGMGRSRLARQWLTESLLLAVLGGGLGLLISRWGGELIRLALLPGMAPSEGGADWRLLAVTGTTVLAAGVLTGVLPAAQAISPSLLSVLKSGSQARTFRRSPLRTGLLLAQTALSTALLIGSGLFVSSFQKVRTQDFGFRTQRMLLATFQFDINVPALRQDATYQQALARLRTLPGVEQAIPTDALPFGPTSAPAIDVPGVDMSRFQQMPFLNAAVPEYFEILGMHLLRGRAFTASDNRRGAPVVVVSETMARSLWPAGDAIGKCLRFGFVAEPAQLATAPCREVVGIVNDARPRSVRPEPQPVMQFYAPYEQVPPPLSPDTPTISGLLIRTAGDPERMVGPVQRALQSFAADLPYANVRPYQALIDPQMGTWRLGAVLFSVFGGLALAMAAIGLYSVLSYMVTQRSKEMGIRMALGAQSRDVILLVIGEGLWFAGLGILAGGAAAVAASSWLEPLLFATRPWEPAVLAEVALTLGAVTVLASLLPAWRATHTDPNLVLKME